MSVVFCQAHGAEEIVTLLAHAMRQWHQPLHDAGVRVGVLWATAEDDEPPLKRNKHQVIATIKPLNLERRVLEQLDAVLKVDENAYQSLDDPQRLALCDGMLEFLEVVTDKDTGSPKLDAIGRPKLRAVKGDWDGGEGHIAVVRRHGDAAVEFTNAKRAWLLASAAKEAQGDEATTEESHA